jgi:hypothetical protein
MTKDEGMTLLEHLYDRSHDEAVTFRHRWQPGDLVVCAFRHHIFPQPLQLSAVCTCNIHLRSLRN